MKINKTLDIEKGHKRISLKTYLDLDTTVNAKVSSNNMDICDTILFLLGWEDEVEESVKDYFLERELNQYVDEEYLVNIDLFVKVKKKRVEIKGIPFYNTKTKTVYLIKENYLLAFKDKINKAKLKELKDLLLNHSNTSFEIDHVEIV